MSALTCPSCGFSSCPVFIGFTLIYPNFDSPKQYKIELKFICTYNNSKISSIDLSQYQKMIELNLKFNNNYLEDDTNNNNINNIIINFSEIKEELLKKNINSIINQFNNIIISNEQEINKYLSNNTCSDKNKLFLSRYLELNKSLFFFIKIFLENTYKYTTKNLLASLYYIYKLVDNFKNLQEENFFVKKELIDEFINTDDMYKLPFIIKLTKNCKQSKGSEILEGHTLPIVGLKQMRSGLLLSGSCGLLKVWKKIDDINDENYNTFKIFRTVLYQHHLIRNFIELEDDNVLFCRGNQLIEALINDKDPYKETFLYQIAENSLESLASLNNNKNFAAGLYTKIYIYERNNKFPILTLQYHRLFIPKIISLPILNLFCSSGTDNKVIIYNSLTFELFSQFEFDESHIVSMCNYNQTEFCVGTMSGKIWYFKRNEENNTFDKIGPIIAHHREIYGILQIKNGEVVSVSRDGTIKFWNIQKKICICKIILDKSLTYDHICQLDDGRLCFASCNNTIKIFYNLPFFNLKCPSLS